jgi:hypothetical protein
MYLGRRTGSELLERRKTSFVAKKTNSKSAIERLAIRI